MQIFFVGKCLKVSQKLHGCDRKLISVRATIPLTHRTLVPKGFAEYRQGQVIHKFL